MRFVVLGICALVLATVGGVAPARAADPQPYKVDLASTGEGAMDSTLHATSDLVSLRDAPVSPYGLIARARGDLDRLKTVLESYGYYESKVTIRIDASALDDPGLAEALTALPSKHDAQVHVSFELGALYHLRTITIDGELPPSAQGILALKTGAPAVAADVLGAGARLLSALQDQGYAFAKVDPPVAYEDKTEPVLDVTFHVETGPRVKLGEIRFEGLRRVHEKLLRRRLLLHTGEQFSASAVERARTDLLTLGVFAAISVKVGSAVDSTGGVPVTFQFRERLRHAFGINAAYSTDLGGSGGITWTDRNVFGNAEQLTVAASLINAGGNATNGLGYDTSIKYTLPDFGHRDQSLQFVVQAIKQNLEAYDQTALKTGIILARKLNRLWTVSVGVTTTEEQVLQDQPYLCTAHPVSSMPCTVEEIGDIIPNPVTHDYTLVALPLTVTYDSTDLRSPLDDPTHGMRDSVSVAPTLSLGQTSATFIISTVKAAFYFDLDHLLPTDPGRSVIAVRGLAGVAEGASTFSLPPDQRFYGGGSSTIRGYPYQLVGPEFYGSNNPTGATTISAGTLEFRQRFGQNWGSAFFVDGGQVGNAIKLWPSGLFVGLGGGVRYYTPIGPVRLDVAFPTKHYSTDDERFQVYIGLGQAF
jgi:translocation and assembly module TamA